MGETRFVSNDYFLKENRNRSLYLDNYLLLNGRIETEHMASKHFPTGLDGRMRDQNGQIRQKNGNTEVGTLRQTYGDNFAAGIRADAHLDTVLHRAGVESLSQFLKKSW